MFLSLVLLSSRTNIVSVQVMYIDSLDLQGIEVSTEGTRVSAWTNAMVKEAVSEDMNLDGTFGRASVCEEKTYKFSSSIFIKTPTKEGNEKRASNLFVC